MQFHFQELLDFDLYANEKFFDILGAIKEERIPRAAIRQVSHLLNAHSAWNSRILKKASLYGIWEIHERDNFREIGEDNFTLTRQIIEELPLNMSIRYENSKGEPFTNSLSDILFHIFHHSNYHRAQTANILRDNGVSPPETNYIFYKR
ncbi:DinB family protein [Sediminitomix flava]|uniref:Putative damage-inducible protein DinB n=1 Tax=Sediminitomix flava TaxID=379075 RepID=A0A315ZWX3_SEDFL|nr:DinB family protein [Sediminitomix flava]PWJ41827.1 putative damage-inducible protein DinB [Sediminitomix flava]